MKGNKEIKEKKKFRWKRFFKRLSIFLLSLGLVFFFAFKYAISSLEENGIQYSALHYSFPLSLEIEQFTIDQDEFQLVLKKLKLDLSIMDLFSGEFSGESFFAKDLYIVYTFVDEEEIEEEPFNFDFMPYLSFEDVRIENTIIRTIDSTDFSVMTFPVVTASDFIWNDSIYAQKVDYSNGTIAFLQPFTSDTVDTTQTEIEVIPYVPYFFAEEFNTDSLDFILTGEDKANKITNIDFQIEGWNNIPGVDLAINHLYFTVQDTLNLKIDSSHFELNTDESIAIQDFNVRLPGVDFNLKEFSIEDVDSNFMYSINLAESHFSPRYAKYFGAEDFIKTDAPNISLQLTADYFQDTLTIQSFDCYLAHKTRLMIQGVIAQPAQIGFVDVEMTEFNITENDLKQYFDIDAPQSMADLKVNSKLKFKGNKSRLAINGNLAVDELQTRLNININDVLEEKMDATVDVYSPYVNSSTFTNDRQNPTKAYGVNLSTSIDQFTFEEIHDLKLKIEIDSLLNDDYQYNAIDLVAQYKDKISTILMGSEKDDWNLSLSTKDDPFQWDTLHFSGFSHFDTKNLAQYNIQEGKMDSHLEGQFFFDENSTLLNLALDSLTFEHENRSYTDDLKIAFENRDDDYFVKVYDSSNLRFLMDFDEALFSWLQSTDIVIDSMPDFGLNFSLNLDSSFVQDFLGVDADATINQITFASANEKMNGKVNIPFFRFEDYFIKQVDGVFVFNDLKEINAFHIDTLSSPYLYLNDITSLLTFQEKVNAFVFESDAFFPKIQDSIAINTAIQIDSVFYRITFDSLKPQRLGESYWYSKNEDEIRIDKSTFQPTGDLSFSSDEQFISTSISEEEIDLRIDSLNLGDILYYYIPSDSIHSTLNLFANYQMENSAINGKGSIDQIVIDTIDVGNIALQIDYFDNQQFADLLYRHEIGYIDIHTFDLYNVPSFDADISKVDLNALLKLANLDSLELQTEGILTGSFEGKYSDSLVLAGFVEFDSTLFISPDYGFRSSINKQRIEVDENQITMNDFTVLDKDDRPLVINGFADILNPSNLSMDIRTKQFTLVHNKKNNGVVKGEFDIESELHLSSENNILAVTGFVNTLDGNNIEYAYESTVKLEDRSKTVTFMSFDETEKKEEVKRKKYKIEYDVDLNIGNTEIYFLLSKTANEYFRLNCFGQINLETGTLMTPNAFGKLESIGGHVYYEVPLISDVQLDIKKAILNWEGDIFEPKISFIGEEVFRVLPNEVSSDLTSKGEKVPVIVDVEIDNRTLEDIAIDFDIKSNDATVQNYLASLPQGTRSDYAVSMLVYGKINRDAESTKSSYESIVNKLNEISRRNFKNMDLSFRIDQYKNQPSAKTENYNKIGVDLSRNFLKDKLRVSAGGTMDVNNGDKNSPLSGYAKITYQLRKKPDVYLMTSHTNNYQGPLVGRVDQSSIGIEVDFEFDNLFKRNKKQKKNE